MKRRTITSLNSLMLLPGFGYTSSINDISSPPPIVFFAACGISANSLDGSCVHAVISSF